MMEAATAADAADTMRFSPLHPTSTHFARSSTTPPDDFQQAPILDSFRI